MPYDPTFCERRLHLEARGFNTEACKICKIDEGCRALQELRNHVYHLEGCCELGYPRPCPPPEA